MTCWEVRTIGKYSDWLELEGLQKIETWARAGLSEKQIAHNMGCGYSTLQEWKKKYAPILQALKKGKEVVDHEVENALLKKALGYQYTETTKEYKNGELTLEKEVTKEMPPDMSAQLVWLKNRKPTEWRDKKDVNADMSGKVTVELGEGLKDWAK